jgi:hypothetical protein
LYPEKPPDSTRVDGAGQEQPYGTRVDQVDDRCGFVLGAASANGDMTVSSACSPELLTLRCDGGDVWTVALGVAARIVYGRDTGRA